MIDHFQEEMFVTDHIIKCLFLLLLIMHHCIIDTLPEQHIFYKNFCCCNAMVSDLCENESQNKIAAAFFF